MRHQRVYRCSPTVVWTKDARQTLVVDRQDQRSWALHGVEAAIWDLLTIGHSYQKLVSMLAVLLSLSRGEAARTLAEVLETWCDAGIVCAARETDGG